METRRGRRSSARPRTRRASASPPARWRRRRARRTCATRARRCRRSASASSAATPAAASNVRCSSSSRPSPSSRQSCSENPRTSRSRCISSTTSRAPGRSTRRISAEHVRVLLVAEVAERAEQVDGGVEARVGERQLAVVGGHELRPALVAGAAAAPPRAAPRAVDAGDAVAGARERHGVAAEAARDVEQLAALGAARQPRRRERLRLGLALALVVGEGAQVEVAEERVPGLG